MALNGLRLNRQQLAKIARDDFEIIRQLERLFEAAGQAEGLTVTDNSTAAGAVYPVWVAGIGSVEPTISATKFSFVPLTGALSATSFNSITGLATAPPSPNTGASVGVSTKTAREDHTHDSEWETGDTKFTLRTSASSGWVLMNDGTIGDALSGATTRANADCHALFVLMWTNTLDAWCPVSGGRGATAEADWSAHKTIALPKALGRTLAASGSGSGLTARALGENLGEETHKLTLTESPIHTHVQDPHTHIQDQHRHTSPYGSNPFTAGPSANNSVGGGSNINIGFTTATNQNTTATNQNAGGDGSHNNMQPTVFLNVMIHL